MRESAGVERFTDSRHAAVHHVARRDQIDAGTRLHHRDLSEQIDGRIVVHVAVANHTAMTVVGVFAQADVPNHEQLGHRALHAANRLLHDALLVMRLGARGVFRGGNAEQDDAAQPQSRRALRIFYQFVDRQLRHTRHCIDSCAESLAVLDEDGPNELRWGEMRFLHQTPQRGGAAQAPHATNRKLSGAHRASKLAAPSPSSKRATASPARSGFESSSSADAVNCTEPSVAVTLPYSRRFPFSQSPQ